MMKQLVSKLFHKDKVHSSSETVHKDLNNLHYNSRECPKLPENSLQISKSKVSKSPMRDFTHKTKNLNFTLTDLINLKKSSISKSQKRETSKSDRNYSFTKFKLIFEKMKTENLKSSGEKKTSKLLITEYGDVFEKSLEEKIGKRKTSLLKTMKERNGNSKSSSRMSQRNVELASEFSIKSKDSRSFRAILKCQELVKRSIDLTPKESRLKKSESIRVNNCVKNNFKTILKESNKLDQRLELLVAPISRPRNRSINAAFVKNQHQTSVRGVYSQSKEKKTTIRKGLLDKIFNQYETPNLISISDRSLNKRTTRQRSNSSKIKNQEFNLDLFRKNIESKVRNAKISKLLGETQKSKKDENGKMGLISKIPQNAIAQKVNKHEEIEMGKFKTSGFQNLFKNDPIKIKKMFKNHESSLENIDSNMESKRHAIDSVGYKKGETKFLSQANLTKFPRDFRKIKDAQNYPIQSCRISNPFPKNFKNKTFIGCDSAKKKNEKSYVATTKNKNVFDLTNWTLKMKSYLKKDAQAVKVSKRVKDFGEKETTSNDLKTTLDFYKIENKIIDSSFSSVYRATQILTNLPVALKIISKKSLISNVKLHQEIVILKRISDRKYLMKLLEVFEDENFIYLVLEYHKNGDLITYLNNKRFLSEDELAPIFKRISMAVKTLHNLGIIHRDIKMDNVMLDQNGDPVLSDFGISSIVVPNSVINDTGGTPAYLAPEVINASGTIGYKTDVWGLGVLLFALVFGALPFQGSNFQELYQNILTENYSFPDYAASSEVKDLIKKLLKVNLSVRCSIDEMLEHQWFKNKIADDKKDEWSSKESKFNLKKKDIVLRYLNDAGFGMDYIYNGISNRKLNHVTACFENLILSLENKE